MGFVRELLELMSQPARVFFALWFVGCGLLFLPDGVWASAGVSPVGSPYRLWIALGSISAFALWLIALPDVVRRLWRRLRWKDAVREALSTLSQDELFIFAEALSRGQRTVYRYAGFSAVASLQGKNLAYVPAGGHDPRQVACTIRSEVWTVAKEMQDELLEKAAELKQAS